MAGGGGGWRTLERQRGRVPSKARDRVECTLANFLDFLFLSVYNSTSRGLARAVSGSRSQIRSATPHNTPLSVHLLPFPSWNLSAALLYPEHNSFELSAPRWHVPTLISDPTAPSISFDTSITNRPCTTTSVVVDLVYVHSKFKPSDMSRWYIHSAARRVRPLRSFEPLPSSPA